MKTAIINPKTYSEKWIESCFSVENIPDNTMFLSHSFDTKDQLDIDFYLKFNNEFYYFKGKNSTLTKMGNRHKFYKIKSLNEIRVTDINDEDMIDFWKKYNALCQKQSEERADSYQLSEEDINAFKVNGVDVKPVIGAKGHTKKSSAINYDGVQYCITFYGDDYKTKKESIAHHLNHFEQIKKRHHQLIKDVYNHLVKTLNTDEIFAIPGGGSRIDVTFGYSGGCLGTITLDMDTPQANLNRKNDIFIMTLNASNRFFDDFQHNQLNIIYT